MYCNNCGKANDDGVAFCSNCGKSLNDMGNKDEKRSVFLPSSNIGILIIGGIAAIVGVVLLVYGDSQNRNIVSQLGSLFGSGKTDPGTPWMIGGGIIIGIGVILIIKKLVEKKD